MLYHVLRQALRHAAATRSVGYTGWPEKVSPYRTITKLYLIGLTT